MFYRRTNAMRMLLLGGSLIILVTWHVLLFSPGDVTDIMYFHITMWSPLMMMKPDNRRIYFHETSGRNALDLRQSCAVESAAKENPDRPIQLFMQTAKLDSSAPWFSVLEQYSNIAVILINETEYFSGSPLEDWYQKGLWRKSPYQREHFSDYIRMLSLLKGGGLYMDLDFITLKPLDEKIIWNFFPIEDTQGNSLTGSIFHLEHGHRLIDEIIRSLSAMYDPALWGNYGPGLVTQVMSEHCEFQRRQLSSNQCHDVQLLPHRFFYPIPFSNWEIYFQEVYEDTMTLLEGSYGVHVWNKLSKEHPLVMGFNQLYAVLAAEHCPLTFVKASEFSSD